QPGYRKIQHDDNFRRNAQHNAMLRATGQQGFQSKVHATIAEVAQERVSSPQRKKPKRRVLVAAGLWKKPVYNFIRSPITPDREKTPVATPVSIAREFN